jgi:hypothetical protein
MIPVGVTQHYAIYGTQFESQGVRITHRGAPGTGIQKDTGLSDRYKRTPPPLGLEIYPAHGVFTKRMYCDGHFLLSLLLAKQPAQLRDRLRFAPEHTPGSTAGARVSILIGHENAGASSPPARPEAEAISCRKKALPEKQTVPTPM